MNLRRLNHCMSAAAVSAAICMGVLSTAAQNQDSAGNQSTPTIQTAPPWAYPMGPFNRPEDDGTPKHVPGSTAAFTMTQIRDRFNVPDWHPGDHPPMPDVVAHGRKPEVWGCGYCHLPNGQGRPENAGLAGLPAAYIAQQMADFKNDLRKPSEPKTGPPNNMIKFAKAVTDAEVKAVAEYFSSFAFKPWIRVVESNTVPKFRVAGRMLVPAESGGTEPIGQRIIELPENLERVEHRDARTGFVAYVPVGSIAKGEELVMTGGATVVDGKIVAGKTIRCGICHGPDLKGLGNVPGIAGRSPSYITRQLYDMQHGNRKGPGAELMKAAVANLSIEDVVAIAAYTASRVP